MYTRKYWPFPMPIDALETEGTKRQVSFLEKANEEGHRAYFEEGDVLGAVASSGREGEMIPRGGVHQDLRRYWEIILSHNSHKDDSFFVDGFENAAMAVLQWLQGRDSSQIRSCIEKDIVQKPGQRGW